MKNILLYLWQLPQNIVGAIMSLIKPVYVEHYDGEKVTFSSAMPSGISLGKYIIVYNGLHRYDWKNENTFKHEYGHALQSRMLGWFYLLVIGLPSPMWRDIRVCITMPKERPTQKPLSLISDTIQHTK